MYIKQKYLNLMGMFIAEKPTIKIISVQKQLLFRFGTTYEDIKIT